MADRLHLRPRHRRLLEALLREHLPDVEVWAYGSRVTGRGHEGSDLDLVLRGPGLGEVPLDRLMEFEHAVRESTIPFLVEARDWRRLPERFHREIEREYVVVVVGGCPGDWVAINLGSVCTKIGCQGQVSTILLSTISLKDLVWADRTGVCMRVPRLGVLKNAYAR